MIKRGIYFIISLLYCSHNKYYANSLNNLIPGKYLEMRKFVFKIERGI